MRFQKLRNLIAHYNGNYNSIPIYKKKQFQIIYQISNLYKGPNGLIIISSELPEKYIDFLNSFISKLIERVKEYNTNI